VIKYSTSYPNTDTAHQ